MMNFDIDTFHKRGFVILKSVLDTNYIDRAKKALVRALEKEVEYHGSKDYVDYGMVLNCALYGKVFWELFDNDYLTSAFNKSLSDGCIVYAYTSSSMPPGTSNYSRRIHVDCPRLIPGYVTNVGATIALDRFTVENGATRYLPYSHTKEEAPSEEEFMSKSEVFLADPGDVCIFNARVWHSGGHNVTDGWRHGLTINMCRPWMKQRIDLPRSLSHLDISEMSEQAQQKLGFHSRVPSSYEEYYRPKAERLYKQEIE